MSANQQAEAHAADVARACEALHAVTHGDRHAYVDTATGAAYLVDDEALAVYGRMLATWDEPECAYRYWCRMTEATEIDGVFIIAMLERSHDLDALRAEADADADFDIVVAIDLLRPTLEALLREESDDEDLADRCQAVLARFQNEPSISTRSVDADVLAELNSRGLLVGSCWGMPLYACGHVMLADSGQPGKDDANDEVPAQGSDVVNTRGLF